jgi:tetratricopeptide (TPR) repeat protein
MLEGKFSQAQEIFAGIVERAGQGPEAMEALFLRGDALRALGRPEEALECYDEVVRRRPQIELLKRTLDRKYRLGLDFLQGDARRYFLGMIPYRSAVFGVKILDALVRAFPFESFSDDALYSIANHYFREEQWEEAQPVYERLIDSYPTSEWVPPAYFQLGKVVYNGVRGHRYDPTPIVKARWYFERFLEKRRVGPEAEQARTFIRELREMEARHELYVARFYAQNGSDRGARLYLQAAAQKGKGPDGRPTPAAVEAQDHLQRLSDADPER